jgi:hypothetical protein
MANFLYEFGKKNMVGGGSQINWTTSAFKVGLLGAGYAPNQATDQFWSTAAGASNVNVVGTPQALAGKALADGSAGNAGKVIASSNAVTFSALSGSQVAHVVIYQDTGTAGTSPLVAHWDTGTGLPFTPNGGDLTLTFDATNGVFNL